MPINYYTKLSALPTPIPDAWVALLTEAGADATAHSGGRTLVDHCVGVYKLMQWISPSKSAAAAGMVHSIYSTDSFETQCLPLDARPQVAAVMGERAEFLAYAFCAMDRSAFVHTRVEPGEYAFYDRFVAASVPLAKDEYYDLVDLCFANELEQLHPRTHGVDGDADGSAAFLAALLPNVSKEAIILYDRVFRRNTPAPLSPAFAPPPLSLAPMWADALLPRANDPSTWHARYSPLFTTHLAEASAQPEWVAQVTDASVEFCENDFWDMWVTVKLPSGERTSLALPPEADYAMLQRALSAAAGLDPTTHAVLGLTERTTGPVLSLSFLTSDFLWLLLPETLYGLVVVPASAHSLAAHGLAEDLAVPRPIGELLPKHFDLGELRAELGVAGSPLLAAFAAGAHVYGSLSLTIPQDHVAVIRDAIGAGDAFFDAPEDAQRATSVEFAEAKFAGFASNRFRDWFQVRSVYDDADVGDVYMPFRSFSATLLRLWLVLEAIARDTVAALALGIGMEPERLLALCDKPGLPPAMLAVFDNGDTGVPPSLMSAWDALAPTAASDAAWQRGPDDVRYPGSNVMRFFRYHTGKTEEDRSRFKASYPSSPHADLGIVTVAPVSPNPALEVQSHLADQLVFVESKLRPVEDVTIMLGENLGYLTRGYFRAPFHRVIPNYEHTRYSMPFFLRAHPLAECVPAAVCDGIPALADLDGVEPDVPFLVHEVMDLVVQSRPLGVMESTDY